MGARDGDPQARAARLPVERAGDHASTSSFGFEREGYRKGHYLRAGEDVDAILMAYAVR